MNSSFPFSYRFIFLLISLTLYSCYTDEDDHLKELNIEGKWQFAKINQYDFQGNLISSKDYDVLWIIDNDSIKQFHSYDLHDDNLTGSISFSLKYDYEINSVGIIMIAQVIYKIQSLTENELIFTIRRPDWISETILYRIN